MPHRPFSLSLSKPFDRLKANGGGFKRPWVQSKPFRLSLSKPRHRLRANGGGFKGPWVQHKPASLCLSRDVLHNPREAVVVRIGMGRKASFCSQ